MKKGKQSRKSQMVKAQQVESNKDSSSKPKSFLQSIVSSIVTGFASGLARAAGEDAYKAPPDVFGWLSKFIENFYS